MWPPFKPLSAPYCVGRRACLGEDPLAGGASRGDLVAEPPEGLRGHDRRQVHLRDPELLE